MTKISKTHSTSGAPGARIAVKTVQLIIITAAIGALFAIFAPLGGLVIDKLNNGSEDFVSY